MLGLILAGTAFIQTSPINPHMCDTIEIVRGDPYYEVHYVNSKELCSVGGSWIVELDGVRVSVHVQVPTNNNSEERVSVYVLDNLPYMVEPVETTNLPDDGQPFVFTLLPMMF